MQNHILAANPLARLSHQFKAYSGGNLKPGFSRNHSSRHIRAAHAGRKRAQGTVGTGVRIRTNHGIPGNHQPFFRQKGMFNSHLPYVKIVGNPVLACKIPAALTVFGGLDIFIRNKMVHNQGDFILIKYGLVIHLFHLVNRYRRGNIISKNQIQVRFN